MADDTLVISSVFDPAGLDRGLNAAAASLNRFAKNAAQSVSFKSIGADVDLATADFKAGTITLESYTAALSHAKQEFAELRAKGLEPSRTSLLQIDTALGRTTGRAGNLGTGIARLRSGMAQLAVTSLGASNALGQVAQGALFLAGSGSGAIIKLALGIAAVGFASKKLGEEQAEATKHAEGLLKALKEQAATGTPFLKTTTDIKTLQTEVDRLTKSLERRKVLFGELGPVLFSQLKIRNIADQLGIDALNKGLDQAKKALADLRVAPLLDIAHQITAIVLGKDAADRFALAQKEAAGEVVKGTVALFDQKVALERQAEAAEKAADALKKMLAVQHDIRVSNAGGGNLPQGAGGTARGPLTGGLLSGASAEQITDSRGAAAIADADAALQKFFGTAFRGFALLSQMENTAVRDTEQLVQGFVDAGSAAFALADVGASLGIISEEAFDALNAVGQLSDALAAVALSASTGNILGAVAAGASVLGSLFSESATAREHKQIVEQNTRALQDATFAYLQGAPGIARGQSALEGLPPGVIEALREVNKIASLGRIETIGLDIELKKLGSSLEELDAIARQNGIQLLDSRGNIVAGALDDLREALEHAKKAVDDTAAADAAEEAARALEIAAHAALDLAEAQRLAVIAHGEYTRQLLDIRSRLLGTGEDPAQLFENVIASFAAGAPDFFAHFMEGFGTGTFGTEALREQLRTQVLEWLDQVRLGQITPETLGLTQDQFTQFLEDAADFLDQFNVELEDVTAAANEATKSLLNMPSGINLAALEFQAQAAGGTRGGTIISEPFRGTDGASQPGVQIGEQRFEFHIYPQPGMSPDAVADAVERKFKRQQMSRTGTPDWQQ